MDKNRIIYLYELNRDKKTTPAELEEFRALLLDLDAIALLKSHFDLEWDNFTGNETDNINSNRILNEILFAPQKYKKKRKQWHMAFAVAVITIVGTAGFFFIHRTTNINSSIISAKNDIKPGGNKAYLTLADGKRIALTDAKTGEIAKQSGVRIIKMANGQLSYSISKENAKTVQEQNNYNIIETPKGGQYQINLPDGTKVWLNAASSLKYPTQFAAKERQVELSGEAYFEVYKDKEHPFIVRTNKQDVEVLGTHFNINSYTDEPIVKTTLLEGSVRVTLNFLSTNKESKIIKPGQQSQMTSKGISIINNVDLEDIVAWKNGYFKFNENLESIMHKLARWYDIQIVYKIKPDPKQMLQGEISRNRNLSEVLNMLQYTGNIHFKVEGRRIMVIY